MNGLNELTYSGMRGRMNEEESWNKTIGGGGGGRGEGGGEKRRGSHILSCDILYPNGGWRGGRDSEGGAVRWYGRVVW